MLSNVEKRCRRIIAKNAGHLHKEGNYYWVEWDISRCTDHPEFTERPDDEDASRWLALSELTDYCNQLEEKNA